MFPTVIAKVFRQADSEESGMVDPGVVPALAIKVLGSDVKESEKQMIMYKAETKAGKLEGEGGERGLWFAGLTEKWTFHNPHQKVMHAIVTKALYCTAVINLAVNNNLPLVSVSFLR